MKKYNCSPQEGMIKTICALPDSPLKIYRIVLEGPVKDDWHYHPQGHEFYIFLGGHYLINVEGKMIEAKAGDVIHIEPGEKHRVENAIVKCDCIVVRQQFQEDNKVIVPR